MENNQNLKDKIYKNRLFMKSNFSEDSYVSDQQKQLPQPSLTKPAASSATVELTKDFSGILKESDYLTLLEERKSIRVYKNKSITLGELSFLLWSTQGVKDIKGDNYATTRPVPSGGARHAFETYLAVFNVEGLDRGIYHYLPLEHALEFVRKVDNMEKTVTDCLCDQRWAGKSAVTFFYTVVPYRGEWRYCTDAHKVMTIDAGHVMQNLYLSCHAIGCGTCAIAAYDQTLSDEMLQLDGEEEFVIYAAPVGVIR